MGKTNLLSTTTVRQKGCHYVRVFGCSILLDRKRWCRDHLVFDAVHSLFPWELLAIAD